MISANSPTCIVGMANSQASMTLATENKINHWILFLWGVDYSLLIEKWILYFYHVRNQTFRWYQVNKHRNALFKILSMSSSSSSYLSFTAHKVGWFRSLTQTSFDNPLGHPSIRSQLFHFCKKKRKRKKKIMRRFFFLSFFFFIKWKSMKRL